jgi:hypothetical protein
MRQLFLLVFAVNMEISCFTFLLAHFGHATLAFSCSLKLCINENSFLQASQRYSYVGMFFLLHIRIIGIAIFLLVF